MADRTKIVVAGVYPKPGRLQEVIDVYAGIVPLVHQEPGCELFALHTDGETVFLVEKWATPADLQAHARRSGVRADRGHPHRGQRSSRPRRRRLGPRQSPIRRGGEGHYCALRHHQPSRRRHGIRVFRWSIRDVLVNPLDFGVAPLGNTFRDIPDDEAAATVDAAREQRARNCGQPSWFTAVATWRW